jgi:hypothetical protein
MIPQTVGALLAFLGLVTPGLVYRLVLERRRPSHSDSTFVEVSRIVITSLVFSGFAFAILWLLESNSPLPLPNAATWLARGTSYAATNLGSVFIGVAAQVVIASLLAAITGWLITRQSPSRFRDETVYGAVFRHYAPEGSTAWVHVCLDNDVEFWGYERAHDDRDQAKARTLILAGDTIMRKLPGENQRTRIGDDWDVVILEADHIRYMRVIYINETGRRLRAVHRRGRLKARSSQRRSSSRLIQTQTHATSHLGTPNASNGSIPEQAAPAQDPT